MIIDTARELYEIENQAVKYFAEKLKERMNADYIDGHVNPHKGKITEQDIDELLKEFEE